MNLKLSKKNGGVKKLFSKVCSFIIHHLNFILVITFLVPWIYRQIAINDLSEIINIIEVFVLSSATLALLTFTYIYSMTNLDKAVKKSMVIAGESFFMATIQFIAGLSLFLLINLIIKHFLGQFNITLNYTWEGIISIFLVLIQLIGIYEVASALSNFLKAIIEVYKQFRKKHNILT